METRNNKILGASLSLVAFSFGFASQAYAQTCKVHPTCEGLGYINTADQCKDGEMVKCPFDASKVFCRKVSIPTTKICDTIGDILLDDKTCVTATDSDNIPSNRTPIGVIFDVSRKLAIALEQSDVLEWSSSFIDIPNLKNYTSDVEDDYNGKDNTNRIISNGDWNDYETPAADYAYNYTTAGTTKGDWYLPAAGELQTLSNNLSIINSSLSKVRGTPLYVYYWTSSEYNDDFAWYFDFDISSTVDDGKGSRYLVRPIFSFNASCTPNACSDYTLSSCPANGNCSTCDKVNDDCSDGGTKYKLDSCESGYEQQGDSCSNVSISSEVWVNVTDNSSYDFDTDTYYGSIDYEGMCDCYKNGTLVGSEALWFCSTPVDNPSYGGCTEEPYPDDKDKCQQLCCNKYL